MDAASCATDADTYSFFNATEGTLYATSLRYSCPLAFEFVMNPKDPDVTQLYVNMTCGWDGQWSPGSQLGTCKRKILILSLV